MPLRQSSGEPLNNPLCSMLGLLRAAARPVAQEMVTPFAGGATQQMYDSGRAAIRQKRIPLTIGLLALLLASASASAAEPLDGAADRRATSTNAPDSLDNLHWMSREQVQALPEHLQRPVPSWCNGIYFNSHFAEPATSTDTVITAGSSTLELNGEILLQDQVEISQPNRLLRAGEARHDRSTGAFELNGGIRLDTPEMSFSAAAALGNIRHKQAELFRANYALFARNGRGSAERIEQNDKVTFIERGTYTTCEPDHNGWQLSARRLRLDREKGWGTAHHAVLRVEQVPVIYLPWITFPIDERRKTGLLFPSFGTSNSGGFDVSQPIYFNLHPQLDATVAPRFIDGRGSGFDSEFRYLSRFGRGSLAYGLLRNDNEFNGEDREIARWQHDGNMRRWLLETDINFVSDDFYFKDLDSGLEVTSQTHLPRQGQAEYFGKRWRFLTRLQAWQTIDPVLADEDLPFRRLPQLQLAGLQPLAGPLQLDWLSDATVFARSATLAQDDIEGERVHLQPALLLDLATSWGYLKPQLRLYHSRYSLDGVDTLPSDSPERTLLGANIDAGLFLQRPFQFAGRHLLQTLEPRLFFNYVEQEAQDDLPDFDSAKLTPSWETLFRENRFTGFDRIGDEQSLTLGLTSRFRKMDSGEDLLVLRTGQKFHYRDRIVESGLPLISTTDRRDRSPLITDATLRLSSRWSLFAENQWDSENDQREKNSFRLGYSNGSRLFLHSGFQDRPLDDIQQLELGAIIPVHRHWSIMGRWLKDTRGERSLETMAGIEYRDCCWRISVLSQRELSDRDGVGNLDAERTLLVQINLLGFGGLGGSVDQALERSIPAYWRRK